MQKLSLQQSLSQKLSPQQIQFIKLLQIPTAELDTRIEEELENNPALEEGGEEEAAEPEDTDPYAEEAETSETAEEEPDFNIEDYIRDEDYSGYKMQGDSGGSEEEEDKEFNIATHGSLTDTLLNQLGYLSLDERQETIARHLIGSIDSDGYIRRDLKSIKNDLAFTQHVYTTEQELEDLLQKIQYFDPPGIAARDLRECLLIQLNKRESGAHLDTAIEIIRDHFEAFTKKHYDKIRKKLGIDEEELKEAIDLITRLNPKPGNITPANQDQYSFPDFILTNNNGKLELTLNSRNAPELKINRSYAEMLDTYEKSDKKDKKMKETISFVKQKLDAAKWFIDAIRQRQQTLLKVMNAIVEFQYEFFLEGDEAKLHPMILKDIAGRIDMDISTVSRVVNSKTVQTYFGVYPLKYFFSEGISTEEGDDVSSREIKHVLKQLIEEEDKKKPYSDDKLEKFLKAKGYNIARRTVAKYREQLNIPVARLRKEV